MELMILPIGPTLLRAKCPRCGLVVAAASPAARTALCRAHDREAHSLGSAVAVDDAVPTDASKPAIAPAVQPC